MKLTIISIIISAGVVFAAIFFANNRDSSGLPNKEPIAVSQVIDGKQIIEIKAKGGYTPREILAKADIPTIIKVKTQGTFDCSSALVIPSLNYRTNLAPSGVTEIEVPPQKIGFVLNGTCAMGMYGFSIKFN
ncbi:MAG: cupredoxin domain-containing protein [bacterium]|nr:cupredoxin domain-containing protein [bacterium]